MPSSTLQPGKLPRHLLTRVLRHRGARDSRVVVGPRFGRDAAVIDLGPQYLVLKSDPVTFTADEIGWYAVHVNANDVAVMGAQPAWFQPTILVPPGTAPATVVQIGRDIGRAAQRLGIAVTGGHTEVTPAVHQPVVAGDMQGTVRPEGLVTADGARPGDVVLLTKAVAIEGTAILARSFPDAAARVLGTRGQRTAARLHHRPGISVVAEALAAARAGTHAMHDPTEGGVAAALYELAAASGRQLLVDVDQIPTLAATRALCSHFGLDPLGLIASGALLIVHPPERVPALRRRLHRLGVPLTVIGTVAAGRGVRARRNGKRVRFAWSERDQLTRVVAD